MSADDPIPPAAKRSTALPAAPEGLFVSPPQPALVGEGASHPPPGAAAEILGGGGDADGRGPSPTESRVQAGRPRQVQAIEELYPLGVPKPESVRILLEHGGDLWVTRRLLRDLSAAQRVVGFGHDQLPSDDRW